MSWNDIIIPTKNELIQIHSEKIIESKKIFEINKNKLDNAIENLRTKIMTEIKDKLENSITKITYINYDKYNYIALHLSLIYQQIYNYKLLNILDMFKICYSEYNINTVNCNIPPIENVLHYIMKPIIHKLKEHNYDIDFKTGTNGYYKIMW